MPGILYVLPNILSGDNLETLSLEALEIYENLHVFAVENPKTVRRLILSFGIETNFSACKFFSIHHKTPELELAETYEEILQLILSGENVGIVSDAGMAGIADPGSHLISLAHQRKLQVKPIVGPSSILLALAASGLNGQSFTFKGYLPIDNKLRKVEIKHMEAEVVRSKTSQLFMETPYRNQQLFSTLINNLRDDMLLCIACNLTAPNEFIRTQTISQWKKQQHNFHKKPAIFILGV